MIIITNRNLQLNESPEKLFGKEFNTAGPDELRLAEANYQDGKWDIQIHDDRVEGKLASEHLFLGLQKRMREKERHCLFYVHGFNNDFADVLATAKDLEEIYDVELVVFTWPANGRESFGGRLGGVASYKSDKREAAQSVTALDRVFEKLNTYLNQHSGEDQICDMHMSIMFHSMGNYLFKNLFKSDAYQGETALFDNVILCEADVNNKDHEKWVERIAVRRRVYVTINENDYALRASRLKFGEKQLARLGHYTMNLNAKNAVYIDLTEAKGVKKSHSPFDASVTKKNGKVKDVFKTMFLGGKIERELKYNAHTNTYEVD